MVSVEEVLLHPKELATSKGQEREGEMVNGVEGLPLKKWEKGLEQREGGGGGGSAHGGSTLMREIFFDI